MSTVPLIRPDLRRSRIAVDWTPPHDRKCAIVYEGVQSDLSPDINEFFVDIPEPKPWAPDTPEVLELQVVDTESKETLHTCAFGMREMTIKEQRFFFNNQAMQQRVLRWDSSLGELDDAASIVTQAGFNAILVSAELLDAERLRSFDESGVLLWVDLSGMPDAQATVNAWGNHPSVALWIADADSAVLIRAADSSRAILVRDGIHSTYSRPYRSESASMEWLSLNAESPVSLLQHRFMRHCGSPTAVSVAEFDILPSFADVDEATRAEIAADMGAMGGFGSEAEFTESLHASVINGLASALEAARSNSNLAGYIWTPPPHASAADLELLASVQSSISPLISTPRMNLCPREEMPVTISLYNGERREGQADLSLQVVGPTRQVLWKKKRTTKLPRSGREIWSGRIESSGSTGNHRFVARLMGPSGRLGESDQPFFVYKEAQPFDGAIHIVDPEARWNSAVTPWVREVTVSAPIHIVPPLSNAVSGYPENELAQVLAAVHDGAVAIVFTPPEDWNRFAEHYEEDIFATSVKLSGSHKRAAHAARLHPVFDNLPAPGLLGETYAGVVPRRCFRERGEEDICGVAVVSDDGPTSHSSPTILVRRYGGGRIVFVHLRILEGLGADPVANSLFVNMLNHFSKRSVSTGDLFRVNKEAVEWLREDRVQNVQRWAVLGTFPSEGGSGHSTVYPPENGIDLLASYPGAFDVLNWTTHHIRREKDSVLQPFRASQGDNTNLASWRSGTVYAYTELHAEGRGAAKLDLQHGAPCKVWLNGQTIHEIAPGTERPSAENKLIDAFLKQGRNTILVKLTYQGEEDFLTCTAHRTDGIDALRCWR